MDANIDPALNRANGSGSASTQQVQQPNMQQFDPVMMMGLNGQLPSSSSNGNAGLAQVSEGYLGYPSMGNVELGDYGMPAAVSRTGGYTITEAGEPSSASGAAKRSRSRSKEPTGSDEWAQGGQGYHDPSSSSSNNRSSRHPDLHSLAAAAASLGAEDGHDGRPGENLAGRSMRGKAGRSKVTRALLADNKGDLGSPSSRTRGRGKGPAGAQGQGQWATSGIRGGSPDESGTEDDATGDMSQSGATDAGPHSKRRRTGPSSGVDNGDSLDRTKEDIKRQKNREKQARLRNRRATELEQLQEMAKNQRDEIARMQTENHSLQSQLVATKEAHRYKVAAYKSWVRKLDSQLTQLGKWKEVGSIQSWVQQKYHLDAADMDTNGMDTAAPFAEPGSQEYASLRRGHQSATNAHATPRSQQGFGPLGESYSGSSSSAIGGRQHGVGRGPMYAGWHGQQGGSMMAQEPPGQWTSANPPYRPNPQTHMQAHLTGFPQQPYHSSAYPQQMGPDSPPALNPLGDMSWPSEISSEHSTSGLPSLTKSIISGSSGSISSPPSTPQHAMSGSQYPFPLPQSKESSPLGIPVIPHNAPLHSAAIGSSEEQRQIYANPDATKFAPPSPKMSLDFFVAPGGQSSQGQLYETIHHSGSSQASNALAPRKRKDSVFNDDLSCGDDVVMSGVQYSFSPGAEPFPVYYDTANVHWQMMQNFTFQQSHYAKKNAELQGLSVASVGEDFGIILNNTPGPVLPDLPIEAAWRLSESDAVEFARRLIFMHPDSDWRRTASSARFAQAYEIATAQSDKDYGGALGEPLQATDGDARLPWRSRYTPSQRIVLMRALIAISAPPGSKARYDGMRLAELLPSEREILENWRLQPDRDRRMDLVPGGIILLNTLVRNRQGPFDSDSFIADLLEEGRLFGNPYEMYAWEPPDHFWYRWRHVLPKAMAFCRSLRPWRRLRTVSVNGVEEVVCGATPYQIIMGTDNPHARIANDFGLPPDDWSADPSADVSWRNIPKKKPVDFMVISA